MNGKPRALRRLPLKFDRRRLVGDYVASTAMNTGGSALGMVSNYAMATASRGISADWTKRWGAFLFPPALMLSGTFTAACLGRPLTGAFFAGSALYPLFQATYAKLGDHSRAYAISPDMTARMDALRTEDPPRHALLSSILNPYGVEPRQ